MNMCMSLNKRIQISPNRLRNSKLGEVLRLIKNYNAPFVMIFSISLSFFINAVIYFVELVFPFGSKIQMSVPVVEE